MSLLRDFIELITSQPGALVYQLVTLFAIQLIAGVAVGHWQRERDEPATRLLAAGLGLLAARAVLMTVAVLHSLGLVSPFTVLPPLERFLNLLSSALVIWAFLPALRDRPRLALILLLVLLLVAAGTYAAFAPLWPGAQAQGVTYNDYWQSTAWELASVTIVGAAFIASLFVRGPDWGWLACLLFLWLGGHGLQLIASRAGSDYAGWVRLANLVGLPLLAGLVYRRALRAAAAPSVRQGEDERGALGILEAVRRIETESNLEPALELTARSVAGMLGADAAAVGLFFPGRVRELRVLARYSSGGVTASMEGPVLSLSEHPVLEQAAASDALETVNLGAEDASSVRGIFQGLDHEETGPLLVQPLSHADETFGLILAGAEPGREWTRDEEEMLQAVGLALSPVIASRRARRGRSS